MFVKLKHLMLYLFVFCFVCSSRLLRHDSEGRSVRVATRTRVVCGARLRTCSPTREWVVGDAATDSPCGGVAAAVVPIVEALDGLGGEV